MKYIMLIFFLFWVLSFTFISFIILDYFNAYNNKKEFFVSSPVKNAKIKYSKYLRNIRISLNNLNGRVKNTLNRAYSKIF